MLTNIIYIYIYIYQVITRFLHLHKLLYDRTRQLLIAPPSPQTALLHLLRLLHSPLAEPRASEPGIRNNSSSSSSSSPWSSSIAPSSPEMFPVAHVTQSSHAVAVRRLAGCYMLVAYMYMDKYIKV